MSFKNFKINEIVKILKIGARSVDIQQLGIIREKIDKDKYLVYMCDNGDLVEVDDLKLISTGKLANNYKFDFYEIVKIISHDKYIGNIGFIDGKSQNEEGSWYYGVYLLHHNECCCCEEHELETTGKFADPKDYYSGDGIKVIVYPDGRGEIKEE